MLEKFHEPVIIRTGRFFLPWIGKLFEDDFADDRLKTSLGKPDIVPEVLELPTPVILDAYYSRAVEWNAAIRLGFGAVTTKTMTVEPRKGHPYRRDGRYYPRVIPCGEGYINCEGFPNPGMHKMKEEGKTFNRLREKHRHKGRIIRSITWINDIGELKTLAQMFPEDPLEWCASSPNTEKAYISALHPEVIEEGAYTLRETTSAPLGIKLSPDFPKQNLDYVIPIVIKYKFNWVKWGNTTMVVEPRVSMGRGGKSGPELFDATYRNVGRAARDFGNYIDFIAAGGVNSPERTEMVLNIPGVKAVALLSAFPKIPYNGRHGFLIAGNINRYLSERINGGRAYPFQSTSRTSSIRS